ATPFLQINNSPQVVGITDEFLVTLSDSATYQDLQTLSQQTNTQIISDFGGGTYILSATKNAQGNALEMANFFHEQPEVKIGEPNFFVQI
ncbi:MAG: hypothetical protein LPK19_02605, partial [Hymenobacteraceae bacterium]|nr:hypothetical protein [Hymenobacteraceae bacterium]MDX5395075.1 hypothetical protein [Hymenobacteraceae bacterium]MDX5511111.1 hypothetical protein [Hymenobacteraceae bacterium]